MKSFIEVQFPVAQLSIEGYLERKAMGSKILSSLAKWWGAKPIVLSRALFIGTVMPAHDNPEKWPEDLEIFLRLMTLDPDGMWHRKVKPLPAAACWPQATLQEREELFQLDGRWKVRSSDSDRLKLERRLFSFFPFTQQREYCCRVDQVDGPSPESWQRIKEYFCFDKPISNLAEIVPLLSLRRFGRVISVGDAFSGSGIIPISAAQIGLPAYASDLNPAASLITWNAVNLIGGKESFRSEVFKAQDRLFKQVESWIDENGYERSEEGWFAQYYFYCEEIKVPEWDNWSIPVAPHWIVAPKLKAWINLIPVPGKKRFNFKVCYGGEGFEETQQGTKDGESLVCPSSLWKLFQQEGSHKNKPRRVNKKDVIQRAGGLRRWAKEDIAPRQDDVLQERLFCIRWLKPSEDKDRGDIFYRESTEFDLKAEERIAEHLKSVFHKWNQNGWIPSWRIEPAYNTSQPIREKGWTFWHQMFTPHQLLIIGKYSSLIGRESTNIQAALMMPLAKVLDANNRLCRWRIAAGGGIGGSTMLFYNQAFNTFPNYIGRSWQTLIEQCKPKHINIDLIEPVKVMSIDARNTEDMVDLWLTDPPYADAVHYEELTEFFLAWYSPHLRKAFPDWPKDSRRIQTIKGNDETFYTSMTECYSRLVSRMPEDGFQIIMFTHKSSDVWSDLTMIVWEAGLEIVAVWNVATETSGIGVRSGDHVQTTYNLVLKKRKSDQIGFMDRIKRQVKKNAAEVIVRMEKERVQIGPYSCGYGETDVLLAAQAAAAQVITRYKTISDFAGRTLEEQKVGIRSVLETARQTAADQLLPRDLKSVCGDAGINAERWWKDLSSEERMFFKSLEVESTGESRLSVFQDLSRIYGVRDYKYLMASTEPNASRPIAPQEVKPGRTVRYEDLPRGEKGEWRYSVSCNILIALQIVMDANDAYAGLTHLKLTTDFWVQRNEWLLPILGYFSRMASKLESWQEAASALSALEVSVRNARA